MRNDKLYLEHIRESAGLVQQYVAGEDGLPSRRLFIEDMLRQDAALRRLEILADAASHLSDDLKARHPNVPWRRITDFRNVLAHAYLHLQLDRVWTVIMNDLPILDAAVQRELNMLT